MKLLVLTFYYPPDLAAGSFRSHALVRALEPMLDAGDRIDVLSTVPQRYAGFHPEVPGVEESGKVRVRRLRLSAHRSGMADQSRAFASFARQVIAATRGDRYDLVYATSSRLLTATLGAVVARRARAPLYLDIRDIFADTMKDVVRGLGPLALAPTIGALERLTIRSARRVNLVSPGFASYFEPRYPDMRFRYFTNGIDDEFFGEDFRKTVTSRPRTLLYAGNIGAGQGLEHIVPALAGALGAGGEWRIQLIGSGGGLETLRRALAGVPSGSVELLPPATRAELRDRYRQADCLFLHLNDYEAFTRVLPSKVFEYAATGKPIIAGVGGFCASFIRAEIENAIVFAPRDAVAALAALSAVRPGHTPRTDFVTRYSRSRIMQAMAGDVLAAAEGT